MISYQSLLLSTIVLNDIDLDFVEKIFQNAVIYVCIINPCKEGHKECWRLSARLRYC